MNYHKGVSRELVTITALRIRVRVRSGMVSIIEGMFMVGKLLWLKIKGIVDRCRDKP